MHESILIKAYYKLQKSDYGSLLHVVGLLITIKCGNWGCLDCCHIFYQHLHINDKSMFYMNKALHMLMCITTLYARTYNDCESKYLFRNTYTWLQVLEGYKEIRSWYNNVVKMIDLIVLPNDRNSSNQIMLITLFV